MTGTMGEARVPNPTSHLRSIHQRTITALRVQQRLTGADPLWVDPRIEIKKIMTRIRITEEAIANYVAAHGWIEP